MTDTLSAEIIVVDKASTILQRISQSTETLIRQFTELNKLTSSVSVGSPEIVSATTQMDAFRQSTQQVTQQMEGLAEVLRKVGTETDQNTRKQNTYTNSVKRSGDAAEKLKGAVIGIGATLVSAYAVNKFLDTSSLMTNTKARLDLINDGQQTTADLNNMIFQSANRAYGSYLDTADAVAKLAGQTGELFNSTADVVRFTELLNKQFIISGVSSQGTASVMLQLTQALSSGVLRGEEFNAIFENTPQLIDYIAAEMDQPREKMRELASEGKITADIIRDAMFHASDQINTEFETMPIAWEDVKTKLQNVSLQAFQPLWKEMESIMNSSAMTDSLTIAQGLLGSLGAAAGVVASALGSVLGVITGNWSIAGPILMAGIAILGTYGSLLMINSARLKMHAAAEMTHKTIIAGKNAVIGILNMTLFAYRMRTDAAAAAAWRQSIAMYAASGGMMGFAAAAWMAAAPLLPFIAIALLVVGAIYLIVFAFNKLTGSSLSATGIITGALYGLYAVFYNIFAGILNFGMKVIDILTDSIEKLVNGIIGGLNWVINALNYIPGVNIKTIGKVDMGFDYDAHKIAYKDVGAYYDRGYSKGEGFANSVGGMFSLSTPDSGDLTASSEYEQLLSGIQSDTEQIADNTELTTDDINALIDLAKTNYRERINVVTVNYTATFDQKISKDADVDGVVREIEKSLTDALNNGSRGVHS